MLRAVSGAGFIDYAELFKRHSGTSTTNDEGVDADTDAGVGVGAGASADVLEMSERTSPADDDIPIHMEICSGNPMQFFLWFTL